VNYGASSWQFGGKTLSGNAEPAQKGRNSGAKMTQKWCKNGAEIVQKRCETRATSRGL
jgi:hypothetical protein